MSLPALPATADTRALSERVNVLIRELNRERNALSVAIAGGAVTLDARNGALFRLEIDGDIGSLTLRNLVPGTGLIVELTGTGTAYAQTWPWTWLTGTPVLTTTDGKRDLAVVWTFDGTEVFAALIAQHY